MMRKQNYKKMLIWQNARVLTKDIYLMTQSFPQDEKFGIISQIRRAIVSVSCNIVEGSARNTAKDFAHFLNIAYASLYEVENLMILSLDLNFINENKVKPINNKIEELIKMIYAFRQRILND